MLEREPGLRERLRRVLVSRGFEARAGTGADDLPGAGDDVSPGRGPDGEGRRPDVVLLDLGLVDAVEALLPESSGDPISGPTSSRSPDVRPGRRPAVVATVEPGQVGPAVEAVRRGALDCLEKPLSLERLTEAVERAAAAARSGDSAVPAEGGFDGGGTSGETSPPFPEFQSLSRPLVGRSPALRRMLGLIGRVAPTRSTVLVTGETGTGKELVARAVHELSPRASGPFLPVVCSALPESLLEAELFGHRKGAFTGAHADRRGLVEEADGGTLFLDEIATVPPSVQVKLLRVLEERRVKRVGGGGIVSVDFRLVAATNRDLRQEVEAGRFREDLYYRLHVFPVRVPPLRKRTEDIPLLAEHFRRRFAEENELDPPAISPPTMARMKDYHWPGNVRELEHFVERAMLLYADEPCIRFDPPSRDEESREEALLERARREEWDLDRLEREYILMVLEDAGGNRSRAADILGVHRRTVARKLKRYRLSGRFGRPRGSSRSSSQTKSSSQTTST